MVVKTKGICVLAFGGNALLHPDDEGTQQDQARRADQAAKTMADIVEMGWELLIVHGNGPQAGNEMIRSEEAATKIPPATLDACVAKTQGSIGYLLERAIRNALLARGIHKKAATILSMVLVDPKDPLFRSPSKPVGPYFPRFRARQLMDEGLSMVEIPGRGFRRTVVSPKPVEVLSFTLIQALLNQGAVVIAGGGGGIPVFRRGKKIVGVEAVIDKDYTAALLADSVDAGLFIVLTEVDRVAVGFGTPQQQDLEHLTLRDARRYMRRGEFPPGSMGPKIDACIQFVKKKKNREALITSSRRLALALKGKHGTRIST